MPDRLGGAAAFEESGRFSRRPVDAQASADQGARGSNGLIDALGQSGAVRIACAGMIPA